MNREVRFGVGPGLLEELKRRAPATPRRRCRVCLHGSAEAPIQEMVTAVCRDAYFPPHRHGGDSESLLVLEGELALFFFDDSGRVSDRVELGAPGSGRTVLFRYRPDVWHSAVVRSETAVLHEARTGPWVAGGDVVAPWAPAPSDAAAIAAWIGRTLETSHVRDGHR